MEIEVSKQSIQKFDVQFDVTIRYILIFRYIDPPLVVTAVPVHYYSMMWRVMVP